MIVDESARGQGVGEALVREALRRATELGVRMVELTSMPYREAANRLYRRLGFVRKPTNVYVWWTDGNLVVAAVTSRTVSVSPVDGEPSRRTRARSRCRAHERAEILRLLAGDHLRRAAVVTGASASSRPLTVHATRSTPPWRSAAEASAASDRRIAGSSVSIVSPCPLDRDALVSPATRSSVSTSRSDGS